MPGTDASAESYDPEAVLAKYLAERDKRLVPGRADIRDRATTVAMHMVRRSLLD